MVISRRTRRWIRCGSFAAALVVGLAGMPASLAQAPAQQPAAHASSPATPTRVWDAAAKGDNDQVLKLLDTEAESDPRLAKSLSQLKTNLDARETKRTEQTAKVTAELDKILASDRDDISLSLALRSAVELHMLALDKNAVLKQTRIVDLIKDSEAAAKKAEERSDYLTANDLYSRLNYLLEEQGLYKDDVKREIQRLMMIRLYAPERFWALQNTRRNAEIAWKATHKDIQADAEEERSTATAADVKARKEAETKPLPPYNPMGDDYQTKLAGIDEQMVTQALNRAFHRHVERPGMDKILHSGISNIRTMVTTPDLRAVFPDLAKDDARNQMLGFLDAADAKVDKTGAGAGTGDMLQFVEQLKQENEKTINLPTYALMHEFGNGGMMALDEFSAIIWPDEIRRFNRNTQGHFIGVGIQIELDPLWNIRVVTPLDGTPAQAADIRPGDLIRKVNGTSTEGFTLDQAVDVITGPEKTDVVLTLERDENGKKTELEVPLVRKPIEVYTVRGWTRAGAREDAWNWFIDPAEKIGYVRISQFAEKTDVELDHAIDQMKSTGLNGLILDLRFDPGGLLDQAVAVVSRFIDHGSAKHNEGMVVTTHTKDNELVQTEPVLKGKASLAGIPVIVLVNEGSASASEIVSGALQDYAKAGDLKVLLLGSRSFGKGSVQNVWPWSTKTTDSAVKVTTQYYHLPAGRMIHRRPGATQWGVEPNMTVEMLPMQITDALLLRTNADVMKLGAKAPAVGADAPAPPKPEDLIGKGLDLQLETALVILQSQTASKTDQAMLEKPTANN